MELLRKSFDHVGIPVASRPKGAVFVEATRVWVTSPRAHEGNVEWLYYEPDSPVHGPVRTMPHTAYRTLDLRRDLGRFDEVLLEPFDVGDGFVTVGFVLCEGAPIELMQYADPNEVGWFF